MPNEHRADPTPPPHHGQGRGGSKKESSSLRVSPALHPPERPSPRRADIADHGLGRETRERRIVIFRVFMGVPDYSSSSESYREKQKLIKFIVIFHRGVSVNHRLRWKTYTPGPRG